MSKCATCGKTIFGGVKEKGQVFCNSACSRQYQDSVVCGKCGTKNPLEEKKCLECGEYLHQFKSASLTGSSAAVKSKKKSSLLSGCATIFVGLFLLGVIINIVNPNGRQTAHSNSASQPNQQEAKNQTKEATENESMTEPQKNAVRSAEQYLSMQGFSRDGLIQQLSSPAGNGYQVADATFAVDSLNVDWNQEAVRAAKQYLNMQGFSCKGLIEQLSSSAGSKFTVSQASLIISADADNLEIESPVSLAQLQKICRRP